jgi:hypothetical protein
MTGALTMDNATRILMKNTDLDFSREGAANSNGDWDPAVDRFGRIESLPPQLIQPDGTSAGDVSAAFGIRVDIDDGNTFKNQFKVGNRNGDAVTIGGGTGPAITFGDGFPGNQDKVALGEEGKVRIKGIPTPDFETADADVAVNKRYVDERDAILQQEIIELEEEIEAIAPSVERGKWVFTAVGTVTQPGQFTMYDEEYVNGGIPTGLFKSVKSIWFNPIDSEGTAHAFGDVAEGELLEVFDSNDADFGLYQILGPAHEEETSLGAKYWVIDVTFVRTNEDEAKVAPSDICRFKIFMAPTGGDSGSFVMKTGDTMEGPSPLVFKTKQTGTSYNNPPTNTSYIKFVNDKNGSTTSGSLWLGGNNSILTTNLSLMVRGSVYTDSYYYGYDGSSTRRPRIRFQSYTGSLQSETTVALAWDSTGVTKIRLSGSEGSSGKVLRLNASNVPYWSDPPMPTYTITSSNGNYYIQ